MLISHVQILKLVPNFGFKFTDFLLFILFIFLNTKFVILTAFPTFLHDENVKSHLLDKSRTIFINSTKSIYTASHKKEILIVNFI